MKQTKRILSILLAVLMLNVLPAGFWQASAVDDYQEFNGHYYKAFDVSKSWTEAEAYCENLGGHLATVTSEEENNFIFNIFKDKAKDHYWLGGSDAEQEGVWKWVTGETWSYSNWGRTQPDNWLQNEHYLEIARVQVGTGNSLRYPSEWNDMDNEGENRGDPLFKGFICEWDPHFPAGYDFEEDSYNFENITSSFNLNKKYINSIYHAGHGKTVEEIYNDHKAAIDGGSCYGMSATTASILNNKPSVNIIAKNIVSGAYSSGYCENLRDAGKNSMFGIIGNDENMTISIKDYIIYSHVYQWSAQAFNNRLYIRDPAGLKACFQTISDIIDNQNNFALIHIYHIENGRVESGHTVLAIGYIGNDIIVDDPNNKDHYEKIHISDDYSKWSFSNSWQSYDIDQDNSVIAYSTDFDAAYQILKTGNKVEIGTDEAAHYVTGTSKIDSDKLLLYADSDDLTFEDETAIRVDLTDGVRTEDTLSGLNLYWLTDTNNATISDIKGDSNHISLAGKNKIIKIGSGDLDEISLSIDKESEQATAVINSTKDDTYSIDILSVEDDTMYEKSINVKGIANGTEVTATETETGVQVTGLNDMTITYSKDDDVIATKEIAVADGGEVNITVNEAEGSITTDCDEATQPDQPESGNENAPRLTFFQRILQWFRNLIALLFGRR